MVWDAVPASLRATMAGRSAQAGPDGSRWLAELPRRVDDALDRWSLQADGAAWHGECALVLPVRRDDGSPAALKVTWPHPEAEHEHLALRAWQGRGAVRLLAADPAGWALLLDRLDAERDLTTEPINEACTAIGRLLRILDRPALPQLRTLAMELRRFLAESPPPKVPRRFAEQARSLAGTLLTRTDLDARLVHADLHYENVLAHPDGAWTAIDPKPLAAHPAWALWPALHNRWDEVGSDPRWEIHCRLGWLAEAAGVDEELARQCAIIRTVKDAAHPETGDRELTARITLLKALQPDG